MKIKILLFAIATTILASCTQHVCPTYQNSGIKYHHHQPHTSHTTHHH